MGNPKIDELMELTNIEFYVNNSDATSCDQYIVKNGKYYPLDQITNNQVEILFSKFVDHRDTRETAKHHFKKTGSKLLAIKATIRKCFGELDGKKMDIDTDGRLNLEQVSAEKKKSNLYRNNLPIGDIDEGCLWERKGNLLVLVDEDEFRSLPAIQWQHLFNLAS